MPYCTNMTFLSIHKNLKTSFYLFHKNLKIGYFYLFIKIEKYVFYMLNFAMRSRLAC